jgi:uncharacterized protein (DUF1330 family)
MPAYVISEVTILNQSALAAYRPLAKQAAAEHGGEYLARDAVPDALEGSFEPNERLVILRFPDSTAARAWYSSDTYATALAAANGALQRRLFIVEGL